MSDQLSITLEELFSYSAETIDFTQLNNLLEGIVQKALGDRGLSEDQLVRVVDSGRIYWLTAAEAKEKMKLAKEQQDERLKHSLNFALNATSKQLGMEIQVLMAIAFHTLNTYHDRELIPLAEIKRTEPNLTRISRTVIYQLDQLREIEIQMDDLRQKNPILDDFETKMGQLLNHQKKGNSQEALVLARELAGMKQKYLRVSRGMQGHNRDNAHMRYEIQHSKKSTLSWQRYMAAQREGILQEENQDLRKSVENVKVLLERAVDEKKERFQKQFEYRSRQLKENQQELDKVQQEIEYFKTKEEETDQVISQFETKFEGSITPRKETATPPFEQEQPQTEKPAQPQEEQPQEEGAPKQQRQRMAIMSHRRGSGS